MFLAFIGFDLWLQAEAHRTKAETQLRRRANSDDTIWFVALAKEQLAFVANDWSQWFPFLSLQLRSDGGRARSGIARRQ
jgi:hypothetical protein